MLKSFQYVKYGRMIQKMASVILTDFLDIVDGMIERLGNEGRIKGPLHSTVLRMESTALALWLFRWHNIFPEPMQRLTLDEVHQQYFSYLRKSNGLSRSDVRNVCDELNHIYKMYDGFIDNPEDFVKIGTAFARSVSVGAKTELDVAEITIPMDLMDQVRSRLKEYRKVMKS